LVRSEPTQLGCSARAGCARSACAVPRELFVVILDRIQRFGVPPPLVQRG
jgi:hypothetical protein